MLSQSESIEIAKGLIRNKKYSEAEDVLLEAININKKNLFINGMLADLYIKMENLDNAELQLEYILQRKPGNFYALQKKGDILVKRGLHHEALDILMEIYKRGEIDYFLIKRISKIYLILNKLGKSLEFARKAAESYPDKSDVFYLLFQIYNKQKDFVKARESIDRALKIEPQNRFYYSKKLSLRMNEKNLNSSSIEEILEISDEMNPYLLNLLAKSLKNEGKVDRAIEIYKQIIALDDNEFNQRSLAFLYYKKQEYSRAFKIFISLSDSNFIDKIFLSTIIASAKELIEKEELLKHMLQLTEKSKTFLVLWPRIKKLGKEIDYDESQ